MANYCYATNKSVDEIIAEALNFGTTPEAIHKATLIRGLYDKTYPESNIKFDLAGDTAERFIDETSGDTRKIMLGTLQKFLSNLRKEHFSVSPSIGASMLHSYTNLKENIPARVRRDRVRLIASLFSRAVDALQQAHPSFTRTQIVNGVVDKGVNRFGELFIFDQIFEYLMNVYGRLGSNQYASKQIQNMLYNWQALTTLVRRELINTEGVKMGNKFEYAEETNYINYLDDDTSILIDPEETLHESWNSGNSTKSLFGEINSKIKRFLSGIPEMEYTWNSDKADFVAKLKTDDIGFNLFMNPIEAYNAIKKFTRGSTTQDTFLSMLELAQKDNKNAWLVNVTNALRNNNELLSALYSSTRSNTQLYSLLVPDTKSNKKGFRRFLLKLLNRINSGRNESFATRIILGAGATKETVYNEGGYLINANVEQVAAALQKVVNEDWFKDENNEESKKPTTHIAKYVADLVPILNKLGIDISSEDLINISSTYKSLKKFKELVKNLSVHGLGRKNIVAIKNANTKDNPITYAAFLQKLTVKKEENPLTEYIRKINDSLSGLTYEKRFESKVKYKNSKGETVTMHSEILPSFMGDFFDEIHSYISANDKKGLKAHLENRYLGCPIFQQDGEILNKWLDELIKCCDNKDVDLEDSFAADFIYIRLLGSKSKPSTDFTSNMQLLDMITEYFSEYEVSHNSDNALYPVFILGDSGVSKYIKAKRYSAESLYDMFYTVYRQEFRRKELVEATKGAIKGFSGVENFFKNKDKFSYLSFFNSKEYESFSFEDAQVAEIKNEIREQLKKEVEVFKQRLQREGLLETIDHDGVTSYKFLSSSITPRNIDAVVEEYYLNSKFAMIQQLQLMTIDPSFYKNTKYAQKRYKETHSSGKALNVDATDKSGNKYSKDGIERAIYINEVKVNAEDTNSNFMQVIANLYGKDSEIYDMYKENALTDGQGWRTLDSYIAILGMAGEDVTAARELQSYLKKLHDDYPDGDIPAEKLNEVENMFLVLQPLKPFTFTHERIPLNNTEYSLIPVQHKCSEMVLIPELLPKGKLRDMALYMEDKGIDVAYATSVIKVGSFGSVDIHDKNNAEELVDSLNEAYVHEISYSDYRLQSVPPVHNNGTRQIGTQLKKQIMAGIDMAGNYSKYFKDKNQTFNLGESNPNARPTGANIVALYNSLIIADILEAYDDFKSKISNPQKLSDMLIQNIISNDRESLDNLAPLSTTEVDGKTEFAMPLFEGSMEHDVSAFILSYFRNTVNKHKGFGGSLVQASAMGLTGYSEDNNLKFVTNEDKTNILYAECEVPFDLSYVNSKGETVQLRYEDYCNEDGTLIEEDGEPKLEREFPGITSFVAYRIPTENTYSLLNLKAVRYSRKISGGTIKVPAQGTTIAGFDFDIDKLYFMLRRFKEREDYQRGRLDRFISYDLSKTARQNSKVARNNLLIDLIQARLMDPETLENRTTPGGFKGPSKAARYIRELLYGEIPEYSSDLDSVIEKQIENSTEDPEPNYDITDPYTMVIYNQQNQVAGKLIGIFANHVTNHAFSTLMKRFTLIEPISFAGHSYNNLLSSEGINLSQNIAEYLASSVDAVKDPVLNYLNLNTLTADTAILLARLGYKPKEIGLLLNQPIIKEVCKIAFNNDASLSAAITEVSRIYSMDSMTPDENALTTNTLISNILEYRKAEESGMTLKDAGPDFINSQLNALALFKDASRKANHLKDFVTALKSTASSAVGSNFGDIYARIEGIKNCVDYFSSNTSAFSIAVTDTLDFPIDMNLGYEDKKMDKYADNLVNNPLGFEQAMLDANRDMIKQIAKYYPYETPLFKNARENFSMISRGSSLDSRTIQDIHKDLILYLLANKPGSRFNSEDYTQVPNREFVTNKTYFLKIFPRVLLSVLNSNPELAKLAIFSNMDYNIFEEGIIDITINNVNNQESYVKNEMTESWEELYRNEETRALAEELFYYCYYKAGFNYSPISFMHLSPSILKMNLEVNKEDGESKSYTDFLRDVLKGDVYTTINLSKFITQFAINHTDNYRFCHDATKNLTTDLISEFAMQDGTVQDSFSLNIPVLGDHKSKFIKQQNDSYSWIPAIKVVLGVETMLYVADNINFTNEASMTYRRVKSIPNPNSPMYSSGDIVRDNLNRSTSREDLVAPDNVDDIDTSIQSEGSIGLDYMLRQIPQSIVSSGLVNAETFELFTNSIKQILENGEKTNAMEVYKNRAKFATESGNVECLDEHGNKAKLC